MISIHTTRCVASVPFDFELAPIVSFTISINPMADHGFRLSDTGEKSTGTSERLDTNGIGLLSLFDKANSMPQTDPANLEGHES